MSDGKTPCKKCRDRVDKKKPCDCNCKEVEVRTCTGVGCAALGFSLSQNYSEQIQSKLV